ncbi:MAG: hypothetical protein GW938_08510 [Leptospira sp.]|nr:hypothetical protein [Leptospira sp.]
MKIFLFITTILFSLFAYLQLNDPDPILWFSIYIFVAGLAMYRLSKSVHHDLRIGFSAFYLGMSFIWFFQIQEFAFDSEEFRETFGLLIAAIFIYFVGRK